VNDGRSHIKFKQVKTSGARNGAPSQSHVRDVCFFDARLPYEQLLYEAYRSRALGVGVEVESCKIVFLEHFLFTSFYTLL